MLWPGNSPDLNPIEKAWPWMKRVTTARGCPRTRRQMEQRWKRVWQELPQEQLQKWVEGVYNNVQEVLRLNGGNEYREGRMGRRSYKGLRIKGVLSPHTYLNANAAIFKAPGVNTALHINGASDVDDNIQNDEQEWVDEL